MKKAILIAALLLPAHCLAADSCVGDEIQNVVGPGGAIALKSQRFYKVLPEYRITVVGWHPGDRLLLCGDLIQQEESEIRNETRQQTAKGILILRSYEERRGP